MKKKIVKYFTVILAVVMLFSCNSFMYAADDLNTENGISPCFSQCAECSFGFYIESDGTAHVNVSYTGKPTFTNAVSTVKIQKKFLGVFWTTVDIGYNDNEWVVTSTDRFGTFGNTFHLSDSGTYRAVFELAMYGTGDYDVIEDEVQDSF